MAQPTDKSVPTYRREFVFCFIGLGVVVVAMFILQTVSA